MSDEAIGALALAWVAAKDAARDSCTAWREDLGSESKWMSAQAAETALETATRRLTGTTRHALTTDVDVRAENERLRGQVATLQRELRIAQLGAERRNRDLDALHLVWCTGGCSGGVHRYCGSPDVVTEEVVALAERHVARLRTWFVNRRDKAASGG